MENKTFGIVTFAILIEGIITYINQFFVQESFCWQMAAKPSARMGTPFERSESGSLV